MKSVYLDNAATTPIDPQVVEAMIPYLKEHFGNPSSTHHYGRKTKAAIETARRNVAKLLNCSPGEIFFTSGGTEADNMAITCAVRDLGCTHIITSAIEHHAVGHTVDALANSGEIRMSLVNLLPDGHVDLAHLEELLQTDDRTLVSLMYANNEIGNLLPAQKVSELCRSYNAYFHSDTVQAMGHYRFDLAKWDVDFITCAAHKFHGPKGVGFLYVNSNVQVKPLIHGGSQERDMRGGTENVIGIVGLEKAFELMHENMDENHAKVQGFKTHMMQRLERELPGTQFNGDAKSRSLYTVLSCHLPPSDKGEMMLYSLDIAGVACSGGSACTSGSNKGSFVLQALGIDQSVPNIRFSFSKLTTIEEVDFAIDELKALYPLKTQ